MFEMWNNIQKSLLANAIWLTLAGDGDIALYWLNVCSGFVT